MRTSPTIESQHINDRLAAVKMLAVGGVCAILAAVARPGHEAGLLGLGVGLLLTWLVDRRHYLIPGLITTPLALANVLWTYGLLPGSDLEGAHLIGLGLALALVSLASRRGLVGSNPLSPGLWVAVVGALVLGTTLTQSAATEFYRFFESLWMPATVLASLALWRLVWSVRKPPPTPPAEASPDPRAAP